MRLLIGSTNQVELGNLRARDELVNDATVNVTVLDRVRKPVLGQAWPLQLKNVADGRYTGTTNSNLTLERGRPYVVQVVAVTPDTKQRTWEVEVTAQYDKVY